MTKSNRRSWVLSILVSTNVMVAISGSFSESLGQTRATRYSATTCTLPGRISEAVVAEFRKAWRISGGGIGEIEGAVLLYQNADGSIWARALEPTNQRKSFTLICDADVIAIVHTHPNSCNAQPEGADLEIADRLRIAVFTITNRGMYGYDPSTKKISKVHDGVNWLDPGRWVREKD